MKIIKIIFTLFVISLISGCDSSNPQSQDTYKMSADVDGVNMSFNGYFVMDYVEPLGYHTSTIFSSINGEGLNKSFSITLREHPHLGIYHFDNDGSIIDGEASFNMRTWNSTESKYYYSINGQVNITRFDATVVEGTFECTAVTLDGTETVIITNGKIKNKFVGASGREWNGL